jgi:hypothetical protein
MVNDSDVAKPERLDSACTISDGIPKVRFRASGLQDLGIGSLP